MTIRILLAPAGGGKTSFAIARIRELPPLAPVRVLVPDQLKAGAFRRRLAQAGGALGVEIQTFYDLYAEVLTLAGDSLPPSRELREEKSRAGNEGLTRLPPAVRYRLIRHLVEKLCQADRLRYYSPLRNAPGFGRLLSELFEELKRARVFPADLERALTPSPSQGELALSEVAGGRGEDHLIELARLYAAYQTWLIDHAWVDDEGQGWLAAIALEENPALLSALSLLVVDGFDEFNPTQLEVLRLLADRAAETIVTLTGDVTRPHRLVHRRSARARAALTATLGVAPLPLSPDHYVAAASGPIVHLESHLFEPDATPIPAGEAVTFLEAQDRAAEAREALRWIKARVVRHGVQLSDAAIVARDVAPYRPFLEETAAEFGIPLRFASGASLGTNPAVAALLTLLTLPLATVDWSPPALLDLLTSPYFDWSASGLRPGDADRLGDVARAGRVVGGLDQWREAFRRLAKSAPAEQVQTLDEEFGAAEEEGGVAPRRPPTAAEAARLRDVFEEIVTLVTPPTLASLRERVAWIEEIIGEDPALEPARAAHASDESPCRVAACARANPVTAERDLAALHTFKDILRSMVLAESQIPGLRSYSGEAFAVELAQAVEETTYAPAVEGDAVLVASAMHVRGLTFDSVALLGLAEGDFPRAEREDVLLSEADRDWLSGRGFAIQPRLQGDEAAFFYQAVTRARRCLLLCRPYLTDDGQPWEPSPYWSAVLRLFSDAPVNHLRPTDPVTDVASEQELMSAIPGDGIEAALAVLEARSQAAPSPWRGDLSASRDRLAERFGPNRPWSSSRLETYAKCPFYFWAAYVMHLEPREWPRTGFDVLILGSIYHLVLERLYARVPDGDPDQLRAALPQVAQQVYDDAPNDYGFRPTPLWERQQEEMTAVLRRTVEGLIEIAGDYEPTAPELAFGLKGREPLVIQGEATATALRLRGYIDRVDRAPDGRLRIIDYKAGSTPISARDLSEGRRLQLPLYALAAERALGAQVASGFYWHVNSAQPSSLKLEKYEGGVGGAIDTAVRHALEIVAEVRAGQFAPAPAGDACPRFCPAAAFCEQFKPRSW